MIVALSDSETIIITVASLAVALALLAFSRVLLRKAPPTWRKFRLGFFVERDPDNGKDEP